MTAFGLGQAADKAMGDREAYPRNSGGSSKQKRGAVWQHRGGGAHLDRQVAPVVVCRLVHLRQAGAGDGGLRKLAVQRLRGLPQVLDNRLPHLQGPRRKRGGGGEEQPWPTAPMQKPTLPAVLH